MVGQHRSPARRLMNLQVDVAIIGGGPAGATCGTLLRKYDKKLKVAIIERETFPRDHVGESQLPPISDILREMGCWDKVEAADFPIKIGATYRWGATPDLWDFDFIKGERFKTVPRPSKFEGQRRDTTFQVERATYDKILLDHAKLNGCTVLQGTAVREVVREGDRVASLHIEPSKDAPDQRYSEVSADTYVDCSGHSGILRRAMGIELDSPSSLQNIAIWDYWQNADWAIQIGVGGTRIQVMSLGYGWIWFIPLGPTRTSIGLVIPARYYKECGKKPEEIYSAAITQDPLIASLITNATRENNLQTTKDWSFRSKRMVGENWFLAGESCGFADPILSAGMTLAHWSARETAFTILELARNRVPGDWLKQSYDDLQSKRIWQHIRFADYWYTANGQFTELKEFTREIARDAGLDLTADQAFQWLGTGGFINEEVTLTGLGSFDLRAVKLLVERFSDEGLEWAINSNNCFKLDLDGATEGAFPRYLEGRVEPVRCYFRDGKKLPMAGAYQAVFRCLKWAFDPDSLIKNLEAIRSISFPWTEPYPFRVLALQVLEAMIAEGWVVASRIDGQPMRKLWEDPKSKLAALAGQDSVK